MTWQLAKLADIQYLPSSPGSLYTHVSGKTFIRAITLFNGNTSTEVVKLYNVPDSSGSLGAAGTSNQFVEYSLAAKETLIVEWAYPIVLADANDSLQGVTTTGSKVTCMVHGEKDA